MPLKTEPLFSQDKRDCLTHFLTPEHAGEESLDYIGAHGFLTALAICPHAIPADEWLSVLFGGSPTYKDDAEEKAIPALLAELKVSQGKILESGALIELPLSPEGDHEAEIQSWSSGFVEALFLREKAWFLDKEEVVAELTLPVMALSGLIEEELEELIEDEEQYEVLIEQLPETLTDLYLLYRSPPEK
jgi:uncharacterized protein